jgi:ABC-2 type transport system ATP-binding protein
MGRAASRARAVELLEQFELVDAADRAPLVAGPVRVSDDGRRLSAGVNATPGLATALVRAPDAAGALVDNIEVRRPSLDDVFLALTGGHIADDGAAGGAGDAGAPRGTGSDHDLRGVRT